MGCGFWPLVQCYLHTWYSKFFPRERTAFFFSIRKTLTCKSNYLTCDVDFFSWRTVVCDTNEKRYNRKTSKHEMTRNWSNQSLKFLKRADENQVTTLKGTSTKISCHAYDDHVCFLDPWVYRPSTKFIFPDFRMTAFYLFVWHQYFSECYCRNGSVTFWIILHDKQDKYLSNRRRDVWEVRHHPTTISCRMTETSPPQISKISVKAIFWENELLLHIFYKSVFDESSEIPKMSRLGCVNALPWCLLFKSEKSRVWSWKTEFVQTRRQSVCVSTSRPHELLKCPNNSSFSFFCFVSTLQWPNCVDVLPLNVLLNQKKLQTWVICFRTPKPSRRFTKRTTERRTIASLTVLFRRCRDAWPILRRWAYCAKTSCSVSISLSVVRPEACKLILGYRFGQQKKAHVNSQKTYVQKKQIHHTNTHDLDMSVGRNPACCILHPSILIGGCWQNVADFHVYAAHGDRDWNRDGCIVATSPEANMVPRARMFPR